MITQDPGICVGVEKVVCFLAGYARPDCWRGSNWRCYYGVLLVLSHKRVARMCREDMSPLSITSDGVCRTQPNIRRTIQILVKAGIDY